MFARARVFVCVFVKTIRRNWANNKIIVRYSGAAYFYRSLSVFLSLSLALFFASHLHMHLNVEDAGLIRVKHASYAIAAYRT